MDFTSYINYLGDCGIDFRTDEAMSSHITFRIGGEAKLFIIPDTLDKLVLSVKGARRYGVRSFVMGKGSNILFDDEGFSGAVISTEKLNSIEITDNVLCCQCGASFTGAAAVARDAGLSGLEFAYGIPGAVGGAVVMNAGAYGGEVSAVLTESTYYDPVSDEIHVAALSEHCYGYRESMYRDNPGRVVLSCKFSLVPRPVDEIRAQMNEYMDRRRSKQPLEFPSAGSVFKRAPGHFTGKLIEDLGLKGYRIGGAEVSEKHAGFIINRGGAASEDVLWLIEFIKQRVRDAYGIELEEELIYVK